MAGWRELVKGQLLKRGMVISQPPGQFSVGHVKLRDAKQRGLNLSTIVDGGAADGGFTREIKAIYPDAKVLAIEPRDDTLPGLRKIAAELPGVIVAQTLVGDRTGEVDFYEHVDQSSILPDARGGFGTKVTRPIDTIDNLVAKHHLPPPDLIKLDLQGAELVALAGATEALKSAQVVLMEVSFIPIYTGQPIIGDVIPFMSARGFRVYDIHALWHRRLDGALAQGDFLFIREGHPLIADSRWSADVNVT